MNTVATHVRARARRQDGAVPRRLLLHRLAARGTRAGRDAELALPAHPQRRAARACRQRGVTDEQITTMLVDNPRKIFASAGRLLTWPTRRHPIGTQVSPAGRRGSRCARGHLRRPHPHPRRAGPVDEPAGPGIRRASVSGSATTSRSCCPTPSSGCSPCWPLEARRDRRSRCRRGCPTPNSRRCSNLRPQALLVGRDDPRGCDAKRARRFHRQPDPAVSDADCPKRFHRCGSRWPPAAAPAGPS